MIKLSWVEPSFSSMFTKSNEPSLVRGTFSLTLAKISRSSRILVILSLSQLFNWNLGLDIHSLVFFSVCSSLNSGNRMCMISCRTVCTKVESVIATVGLVFCFRNGFERRIVNVFAFAWPAHCGTTVTAPIFSGRLQLLQLHQR